MWWFWWWLILLSILFVLPIGYGWGYRRWGYPYPSWTARAREARAREAATWGFLADFVWFMFLAFAVWLIVAAIVA
ncbi:MAG: hypothetical protein R3290_10735 [Acidimicrobiia bacterium]|nr:hypothetical protein [Acidimicrobiia bacterium]